MNAVFERLGLSAVNAGTWTSAGGWLADDKAPLVDSINPSSGQVIASVRATTAAQYEQLMAAAHEAAAAWRYPLRKAWKDWGLGRLLVPLILHVDGVLEWPLLYLSLYFKQRREEYYARLGRVRTEGDWEGWVMFFAAGVVDRTEDRCACPCRETRSSPVGGPGRGHAAVPRVPALRDREHGGDRKRNRHVSNLRLRFV